MMPTMLPPPPRKQMHGCLAALIVAAIVIAGLAVIGAVSSLFRSPAKAPPTSYTSSTGSADYRVGKIEGERFGRDWATGAGHPRADLMPVIARRQWESLGRSYSPQAWQDGWVAGFEEGFNAQKSGTR